MCVSVFLLSGKEEQLFLMLTVSIQKGQVNTRIEHMSKGFEIKTMYSFKTRMVTGVFYTCLEGAQVEGRNIA